MVWWFVIRGQARRHRFIKGCNIMLALLQQFQLSPQQ
jgi:hypothetical protein